VLAGAVVPSVPDAFVQGEPSVAADAQQVRYVVPVPSLDLLRDDCSAGSRAGDPFAPAVLVVDGSAQADLVAVGSLLAHFAAVADWSRNDCSAGPRAGDPLAPAVLVDDGSARADLVAGGSLLAACLAPVDLLADSLAGLPAHLLVDSPQSEWRAFPEALVLRVAAPWGHWRGASVASHVVRWAAQGVPRAFVAGLRTAPAEVAPPPSR